MREKNNKPGARKKLVPAIWIERSWRPRIHVRLVRCRALASFLMNPLRPATLEPAQFPASVSLNRTNLLQLNPL